MDGRVMDEWVVHEMVSNLYNWVDVATRTVFVYDMVVCGGDEEKDCGEKEGDLMVKNEFCGEVNDEFLGKSGGEFKENVDGEIKKFSGEVEGIVGEEYGGDLGGNDGGKKVLYGGLRNRGKCKVGRVKDELGGVEDDDVGGGKDVGSLVGGEFVRTRKTKSFNEKLKRLVL